MLKLIKLELKKNEMRGYVKGGFIADLIISGVILAVLLISKYEGNSDFSNYTTVISMIDSSVKGTFLIFAAVILSRLVIEEYKNKTINLMFMYPVNRKKLITVKLIIVFIFTFISVVFSNIFINGFIYTVNLIFNLVLDNLTMDIILREPIRIVVNALTTAGIGLIPLYFGMKKKSASAMIVTSIILVFLIGSDIGNFSLASIIAIPITLSIIGICTAYLAIKNIEHVDVV